MSKKVFLDNEPQYIIFMTATSRGGKRGETEFSHTRKERMLTTNREGFRLQVKDISAIAEDILMLS
jgi:hypothetical protein